MKPYFESANGKLYHGDCLDILPELSGCTACITDPPYGISFMGKGWDHGVPGIEYWKAVMSACLPGAMLMAFGGTRTVHRLVCAIEDAGWEIRDGIEYLHWIYGSGFPKSLDISKGIDKQAGVERIKTPIGDPVKRIIPGSDQNKTGSWIKDNGRQYQPCEELSVTKDGKKWNGYGTALKPAHEPICLAMKPVEGTFVENALKYGVAGLNIKKGLIGTEKRVYKGSGAQPYKLNSHKKGDTGIGYMDGSGKDLEFMATGRWPANIIHDGSPEVVGLFPNQKSGAIKAETHYNHSGCKTMGAASGVTKRDFPSSCGSVSRFFYCAKASRSERNRGYSELITKERAEINKMMGSVEGGNSMRTGSGNLRNNSLQNNHPTVKPLALIKYLLGLVTMPENNLICDPYLGSGTTTVACEQLGLSWVGIEISEEYCEIAAKRILKETQQLKLKGF